MRRRLLTLLICLTCLSALLSAQAPYQGDSFVLSELNVTIERAESDPELVEAVLSRLKSRVGEPFSQEDFDEDLKTLSRDFLRVEPLLDFSSDTVRVDLRIWPKPVVRRLAFEGNEMVDAPTLRKQLGVPYGSIFERRSFHEGLNKIKQHYVKKGFFEVCVTYDSCIDDLSNEIDLTIHIDEGRCGRVRNVEFVNFWPGEVSDLSNMINTQQFSVFTSWLTGTGTFREQLTEQDRFIILNYMQNRGFADAKVDLQVEEIEGSRELEVILTLDRGPRYRFGRVSFAGNQLVDDETLHSLFTIEDGAPFSVDGMRETSTAISDYYGRRGYIDAYANFQPSLRLDKAAYDVHFQIVEGEQYRVGMIKVYGNTTTHPDVILNECLLIPGEVFNSHKLQQTEARLQNIGYFESVNVYAIPADDDPFMEGPRFRDIHIEVCETSTGDFGFSAGFSSSENAFIGLNYTERNFNWRGIPRIFEDGYAAIRGGGEHFALRADFGSSNHRYALSWTEPYFCNSDWALGFDADHSSVRKDTNKDNGFSIDSYGFSLHATRIINQFLKFSVHYRLRDSDVDLEKAGEAPTDKRQEAANAGFISGAGFNLLYDSTNHPMFPSCGIRSRLLMEYVGFGGPHNFLNFGYFNSYYYSPRTGYIMKLRADAHFLHPVNGSTIQSLPFAERLYLGGEGSLRGYEYNAIGPRYSDGSPRGGLSSLLFSWEYDYKCFPIMDVFTFVDAGALSQSKWTLDNWSATAGYGARLYVMGGGAPVTLGYGWPLWEKDDSIVDRFFITLGSNF